MPTAARNNPTHRTVVLLRPSEKKRLQKLAREENVSSSEIVRRSIQAYEAVSPEEQKEWKKLLAELNASLDITIENIRSARIEIAENNAKMRERNALRV